MSEAILSPHKRRHDEADSVTSGVALGTKRRAFLQTMGQQLRDLGTDGPSPQESARTTFGTSPIAHPVSRATHGVANQSSVAPVDTPESDAAPGEDDQLPAGTAKSATRWLWRPDEVTAQILNAAQPVLKFEDLIEWSQSYFDYWHPAFPFLHAPSILEYFRTLTSREGRISLISPSQPFQHVIVRAIFSISAFDHRQIRSPWRAIPSILVFHSYNDAINSIQPILTEESSILSLQALVSVQLFLITMHRYNAASRLQGLASRIVFQLGLHRCPLALHLAPSKEVELRKRLFWSVFCIDRYVCIRLGTPLGIRSDEVDVCYPHTERHSSANAHQAEHDDRLDLLEFLARHALIRGSIMETRHKTAMHAPIDQGERILEVDADHTKWWNNVDDHLSDDDRTHSISKSHQVVLTVLRFESILALHRSILATSKKNANYNAALQRCISASRSIINTLHRALKGTGAFDEPPGQNEYEKIPLLWPSFTWAVWMSTFISFSAAFDGQMKSDVALKLADRSVQILNYLALRGTNWPEACIVAIQNLKVKLRATSNRSSTAVSNTRSRTSESSSRLHTSSAHDQSGRQSISGLERSITRPMSGDITPRISNTSTIHSNQYVSFTNPSSDVTGRSLHFPSQGDSSGVANNVQYMNNTNIHSNAYLAGSGTFLGIAQHTSDNPLPNEEIMHLFNNEDMTYWLGSDFGINQDYAFH